MTCEECIHKAVCYRAESVKNDYAQKCGDFCEDAEMRKIDEWEIKGKNAELWIVKGGTIHNIPFPSVTPQPKTGHWIDTGSGQECSGCGEIQHGYDNFRHFCANCGAKMEVEKHDN